MLESSSTQQFNAQQLIDQIKQESIAFRQLSVEVSKVVVGNESTIQALIIGVLCNSHILLEGLPGVAKTTMVKALSYILGLTTKRIQFTPDLLPADLIGTMVYNQKTQEFDTKLGPIFANIVIADEINRAPAKLQSALLEAMQEGQVTIGNNTFALPRLFFVFATQNSIDQEGTYKLPEAQIDRFLMLLNIEYPNRIEEKQILGKVHLQGNLQQIITGDCILRAQELTRSIYVDGRIEDYIIAIIFALRDPAHLAATAHLKEYIGYGPSPRATRALYHAAQSNAFLHGRAFVTPDDVKAVAHAVLRHRINFASYKAEADGITRDSIITHILTQIKAP